ncbi:uncharacterized protein LOC127723428 [Mytilus californianus]|uniref:uncharacterized protein LOC127723428 n=1 Tax=Mytilus californianus TaxID=6549 RepID=UPI002247E5EB|nr:uncharacterized protein LOC127723428 [Mytilus californianus]
MANQAPTPIQSSIPFDLERRISELEYSSHTGPPDDLDDNRKRWLVVGICLHSILSPALRKYVDPVVTSLYSSLKITYQIDLQTQTTHLRTYGAANIYLNYEAINNNKATHGYRSVLWDYKVHNAVNLSKLFLPTHMAHYTAFDGSCDSSALLGMIDRIDKFPGNVQIAARNVRAAVRNPWAHCNFIEWDSMKYNSSLQQIEDFIYLLNLNAAEESQFIAELNKWKTNGTSFFQGSTIGLELVDEIRQQIQILVKYADVICKSADAEFSRVYAELREIGNTLSQTDKRISTLENTLAIQGKTLFEDGSLNDADIPEMELWKLKSKLFVETDVVTDIFRILETHNCLLLTGVSGMGKTLTAQHIAFKLFDEKAYSIEPCISVKDIKRRYKQNVGQVFFVDDICGKYTANINDIENWLKMVEFVKCILVKGKTKILATCRTEVFNEESFKDAFDLFKNDIYELTVKYSFQDKIKIASKYMKKDDKIITDILGNVEFSPIMCFLYAQHDKFEINEFLNSPYEIFRTEWNQLKSFDKEKLCVLLFCVIYNGTINEAIFDISNDLNSVEKKKLKDIFEFCKLGRDTPRSLITAKLNACVDTYFIKVGKEYKVIHDKMFDFLCFYFSKALIAPILKYADDKLISERVQLNSIQKAHAEFTIIVSSTDEQKYIDRVKMDLKNGKIHWCLNNVQMRYKEYREKLLDVMKNLDDDVKRRCIDIKDENGINAFIISCMRGYEELIDIFISVGADVNAQNGWFTPLTAACREGHLRMVEILLHKGSNINQTNKNGETPIYTACFGGHYSLAKLLIEKHADINKRNRYHRKPLYVCCLSGHESIVQLLIDKGANVNESSDSLNVAIHGNHDKIVEKLISNGYCLNSVDIKSKTALFIACEIGNTTITKLLIDNNADIYKVDGDGRTPLHAACCVGNNDIVRMLINKNADVNMRDVDLETPLHKSCRKGSVDVILTLLDNGADTTNTNKDVHTPVHLAKTEGNIVNESILKALGENEVGPNQVSSMAVSKNDKCKIQITACTSNSVADGWTPLYEACVLGDIETFQWLIRYGAAVNMQTISGEMPLIAACQHGHGFLIQTLLDERAHINQALVCAVQKDYDRAVKILLYKGGDIGYKSDDGKSLIKLACEHGSIKAIKILSEKGADFTEIDVNGRTLIHVACNTDSVELLQFLIDKGLDLGIPDKNGRYALFVSIYNGFYNLSKYLVQKSCPITISEEDTKTFIISVFESENREMSKLLVSNGYTDKLSHFNETMLYHAYKLGIYENVEILRKYGANIKDTYKYGYTPVILADIGGNDMLSENLQNAICSTAFIRDNFFLNKSIGIIYNSDREVDGKFKNDRIRKRYDHDTETESSWKLQQYEDLFHACMFGIIEPHFRGMLQEMQIDIFFQPRDQCVSIWFEQTPLCLAIRRGHTEVVKFLLRHGVNVNLTFEEWRTKSDVSLSTTIRYGYTPLFAACQRKYYEIVDLLIERGANLNKALYDACREGCLDTVQFLLQKGANVNSITRYGQTALYGACKGGYSTLVKFLIDQGSVVDTKVQKTDISDEITCLHAAYVCGNHDIVQLLINRGASVDSVGNFGRTLLHKASSDGNDKIVKILIDKGVDINASDSYGSTPLIACVLQNIEDNHREYVLQNIEDNHEKYYLYRHMQNFHLFDYLHEDYPYQLLTNGIHCELEFKHPSENHYKIMQLLIENGADINKADKRDRTPLSLSMKIGDMKLTEMLLPKKLLPIEEKNVQEWNQVSRKRRRRNSKKDKH